jgi:stearoyl-CoA desaturase (delta-9 desaturase)
MITPVLAEPVLKTRQQTRHRRIHRLAAVVYWLIHAASLLAFWVEPTPLALALCVILLGTRMFAITGGYHRYFSHRTYRTSRALQLLMAVVGTTAIQKGPLWWAAGHRRHHQYSDEPGDMHSPREGFRYAHYGWIFDERWENTELDRVRDLARFPELVWLNTWHVVPPIVLSILIYAFAGLSGLVWGMGISTVLLWHLTYSINSLAHVWGKRRYATSDTSRNNFLLALLTMGEGWHNNHHHYMSCARQGFFWWEIDFTYYVLRAFAAVGLVWDVREPPAKVLDPATSHAPRDVTRRALVKGEAALGDLTAG